MISTKKLITPEEFAALDEEGKYYYQPQWKQWVTKKIRQYSECDCCGHREFLGWEEERVGVGVPNYYEYHRSFLPYLKLDTVDRLLNSNVLADRILKKW